MTDAGDAMGRLGEYTGLQDKDGTPIHIGQVIRMEGIEKADGGYAFGRVWFNSPELAARRVDEFTGKMLSGSYSLVDWGYGQRVAEFTVVDPHPGATWPSAGMWMCPHCRDHYGPEDEDTPPVCDMCKKAGRT